MRVLVTGGAGFIGSHLAGAYQEDGHQVLVVDDLSSGNPQNLHPSIDLHRATITDNKAMESVFSLFKPEIVNHHAAQINVRHSVEDPYFDAEVNIIGTLILAEMALAHHVSKMIFASSGGAIYGNQREYPAGEDHPTDPLSPYGISKLAAEKYLYYYRQNWGLPYVCLRYSNVYGPRQDPHGEAGVVAIFFTRIIDGDQPVINGDGKQTRDYIYVGDVVAASMAVSFNDIEGSYNVGTGRETSVNELFSLIRDITGKKVQEIHGPAKKGEQQRSSIDASLLTRRTGWAAPTPLPEGLEETYEYFKSKKKLNE